jgi:hypothetical protein
MESGYAGNIGRENTAFFGSVHVDANMGNAENLRSYTERALNSAPSLLEACKLALEWIGGTDYAPGKHGVLNSLRAAISLTEKGA